MPTREEKASHVGTATSENTKQKGGYIHSKKKKEKKRKCILPHTTFHTPLRAVLVRKSDGTECTGKREGGKKKNSKAHFLRDVTSAKGLAGGRKKTRGNETCTAFSP